MVSALSILSVFVVCVLCFCDVFCVLSLNYYLDTFTLDLLFIRQKTVINALDNTMIALCLCIPVCTCVYTTVYAPASALRATLLLELIGNYFAYALSVDLNFRFLQLRCRLKEFHLNVLVNEILVINVQRTTCKFQK